MRPILIALFLTLPLPLSAACAIGEAEIFSCTFNSGKKSVEICQRSDTVSYRFGVPGRPSELALSHPMSAVAYAPWNGIGRAIWESVEFQNADVTYIVGMSLDKVTAVEGGNPFGGSIEIRQNGAEIAYLECDADSADFTVFRLQDAYEAHGLCWDRDAWIWSRDCG